MHHVIMNYTVRSGRVEENLRLLREAYEELNVVRPAGLRWVTYRLDDGVTFVDVVAVDEPGDLARLPAFHRFRSTLDARCEQPPSVNRIDVVGSFRVP